MALHSNFAAPHSLGRSLCTADSTSSVWSTIKGRPIWRPHWIFGAKKNKKQKPGFNVTVPRPLSLLGARTTPHKQNENIFCLFVLGFIYVGRLLWLLWGGWNSFHPEWQTRTCHQRLRQQSGERRVDEISSFVQIFLFP